jgi:hypothetical protein
LSEQTVELAQARLGGGLKKFVTTLARRLGLEKNLDMLTQMAFKSWPCFFLSVNARRRRAPDLNRADMIT